MTYPSPLFVTQDASDSSNYAATTEFVSNLVSGLRTVIVMTATEDKQSTFTPSNSQTFNQNNQNVYLNGLYLVAGQDYTINTGTSGSSTVGVSITLSSTISSSIVTGNEVVLESFTSLSKSNSTGYLPLVGGELSGGLTVDGTIVSSALEINNSSTSSSILDFQTGGTSVWRIARTSSGTLEIQALSSTGTSSSVATITPSSSTDNSSGTINFGYAPTYNGTISNTDSSTSLATTSFVQNNFIPRNQSKNVTVSFTPNLLVGGAASTMEYSNIYGIYQIIGNMIYCQFAITLSSLGTGTGAVTMSLPVNADTTCSNSGGGMISYSNSLSTSATLPIMINVNNDIATFNLTSGSLTTSDLTATSTLNGYFSYFSVIPS